jgi:hypothetical protein
MVKVKQFKRMKMYKMKTLVIVMLITFLNYGSLFSQTKEIKFDLVKLSKENGISLEKVVVEAIESEKDYNGIQIKGPGREVTWLKGTDFSIGEIEVDMKSDNFVGLAFHIADATTYEAVYFRPFNFNVPDSIKRSHAVQYHSLPKYPWSKLREQSPDKYEDVINPVPDTGTWFHVRLVISKEKISCYVNESKNPCMTVGKLGNLENGMLGFFIGTGTGGNFANLKITQAK